MINKEKLAINLNILKNLLPKKPQAFTTVHPLTLEEALTKYCRQSTVHGVQICTKECNEANWPLPLWFNPKDVKVGFWNKLYYKRIKTSRHRKWIIGFQSFEFLWVIVLNKIIYKRDINEVIIEAFESNYHFVKEKLLSSTILQSKEFLLDEVFKTYKKRYYVACISSILPLLDYVARKVLNTTNLKNDIGKIIKVFEHNGFSLENLDYLMPHLSLINTHDPDKPRLETMNEVYEKVKDNEYGLIGPALSSFLRFANHYYGYYQEDRNENGILNRHAILHCSVNSFGNKENAVKLITFLYLFLELEPAFNILLKE